MSDIKTKKVVSIIGAKGKMGNNIIKTICEDSFFKLGFGIVRNQNESIVDTSKNEFNEEDIFFTYDISKALIHSDIIVDFRDVPCKLFFDLLEMNKIHKKGLIIGTTGYSEKEKAKIKAYQEYFAILMSSNFSIGMNVLFHSLKRIASILNVDMDYDLEILEVHHRFKKDKPSGTAITLNQIASKYSKRNQKAQKDIHSLREGNNIGLHEVRFSDLYENLRIVHHAYDRKAFSKGVLLAMKWLIHKQKGFYDMLDVFGFEDLKNEN